MMTTNVWLDQVSRSGSGNITSIVFPWTRHFRRHNNERRRSHRADEKLISLFPLLSTSFLATLGEVVGNCVAGDTLVM